MREPTPTPNPLRVLIADDDPDTREALELAVRALGHACAIARNGQEALEMHLADRADIVLSDWMMPGLDGIELCRRIRGADASHAYTHFIFVTGNDDRTHFLEGMHAGADGYLAKPVNIEELEARLEAAQRQVTLQRGLRSDNSLLRRDSERAFVAARTNPLTLARNRLALTEDLETLVARALRYGHRYCAALCDIDHFKAYNDHFGHLEGDEALRRVAGNIHDHLRRGDGFYRYGGEEFLVILPEQSLAEAALGMGRVRQEVERLRLPHAPRTGTPFVTISIGISTLTAESKGTTEDWLRRADLALYAAKARGRNRVEVEKGYPEVTGEIAP